MSRRWWCSSHFRNSPGEQCLATAGSNSRTKWKALCHLQITYPSLIGFILRKSEKDHGCVSLVMRGLTCIIIKSHLLSPLFSGNPPFTKVRTCLIIRLDAENLCLLSKNTEWSFWSIGLEGKHTRPKGTAVCLRPAAWFPINLPLILVLGPGLPKSTEMTLS